MRGAIPWSYLCDPVMPDRSRRGYVPASGTDIEPESASVYDPTSDEDSEAFAGESKPQTTLGASPRAIYVQEGRAARRSIWEEDSAGEPSPLLGVSSGPGGGDHSRSPHGLLLKVRVHLCRLGSVDD
jgi:hypothetical protein